MSLKRIFLAVQINADEKFSDFYQSLKNKSANDKISWVDICKLHITLKFFGETDEAKIPLISNTIRQTLSDKKEFIINLSGIGIFGSNYKPRLIFAGIEKNKELSDLIVDLQNNLDKMGFTKDRQNLVPHLTLGRIKTVNNKNLFDSNLKVHHIKNIQTVNVNEIILFESISGKKGSIYQIVNSFKIS